MHNEWIGIDLADHYDVSKQSYASRSTRKVVLSGICNQRNGKRPQINSFPTPWGSTGVEYVLSRNPQRKGPAVAA